MKRTVRHHPSRTPSTPNRRIASRAVRAVLASVFVLLPGCTPDGGTGQPDTGSQVQLLCSTDEECDGGFVCDGIRRTCVCTGDSVCAGTDKPFCNAFTGKCVAEVAGCTSNEQCRFDEYCNEGLRACRPRKGWCEPCSVDAECGGPDDRCVTHPDHPNAPRFCATACVDEGDCPDDQACVETDRGRQCVPPSGRCATHESPCNPDSRQPCAVDEDCTAGTAQVCDRQLRECVAAQTSCSAGQVCDPLSLRCEQPCRNDTECRVRHEDPELVCVNRLCSRPDTCVTDDDCDDNRWCYHEPGKPEGVPGACRPSCVSSSECPLGNTCQDDPKSGRKRCLPGCTPGIHSGCPLNAICDDSGQCQTRDQEGRRHCQNRYACEFGENCVDNVCVPSAHQCRPCGSQGCGPNEYCYQYAYFNRACGGTTCPDGTKEVPLPWAACAPENVHVCQVSICIARTCDGSSDTCPQGHECFLIAGQHYCLPSDPGQCIPEDW